MVIRNCRVPVPFATTPHFIKLVTELATTRRWPAFSAAGMIPSVCLFGLSMDWVIHGVRLTHGEQKCLS